MHLGLCYILQGIKLRNFDELATCAQDMELIIVVAGNQILPVQEPIKCNNNKIFAKIDNE